MNRAFSPYIKFQFNCDERTSQIQYYLCGRFSHSFPSRTLSSPIFVTNFVRRTSLRSVCVQLDKTQFHFMSNRIRLLTPYSITLDILNWHYSHIQNKRALNKWSLGCYFLAEIPFSAKTSPLSSSFHTSNSQLWITKEYPVKKFFQSLQGTKTCSSVTEVY